MNVPRVVPDKELTRDRERLARSYAPPRIPFALTAGVTRHRPDANAADARGPLEARITKALAQLEVQVRALGGRGAALAAWPKRVAVTPQLAAWQVLLMNGLGRLSDANAIAAKLERLGYRHLTYLRDRRVTKRG